MFGIDRVHGVFHVYIGGKAPQFLCFGHYVDGQRGLARRLGSEDFGYPATGNSSGAQCHVKSQGASRNHFGC